MSTAEREMLDLFVQEAAEHLGVLETDLIALESAPRDPALLNRLFRAVHSVKGTAGFFGFTAITGLAHGMESVMALLRDGRMDSSPALINTFLAATDKLRLMVADPGGSSEVPVADENAALQALLRAEPAASPAAPELPAYLRAFTLDPELVRHALRHGQNLFVLQIRLQSDIEAKGRTILDYFHDIESLGTLIDTVTDLGAPTGLETERGELVCSLVFATPMEADLLLGAFDLPAAQLVQAPAALLVDWVKAQPALAPASPPRARAAPPPPPSPEVPAAAPLSATAPAVDSASAEAPAAGRTRADETVRISVTTLDALMNLAGEMVLGRNQLLRLAAAGGASLSANQGLAAVAQNINGVTTDLQRAIMRARLQPVGGLFGRFPRVFRELGRKLGKEIRLETTGEEVELDRALLEGLSDPLTHLVRNAADHGIEPPEERLRLGKPAAGLVRIGAAHLAGRVQIEIHDDGRGLDPERIKAKAVEKGLISAEQAARLDEAQARELIFAPGFSTAAVVSDVSGRGVGMDVVKTNIERLGGRVELRSTTGQGTSVLIRLPLTLAIIPALLVSCGERRFAVPQLNLEEIVRPDRDRPLEDFGGARVLRLREELIPVLELPALLGLPALAPERPGYVLVLRTDRRRFGLRVKSLGDTEEIVVKPLGRHLRGLAFYSGATLLGQGEVALILDPAGLAAGRLPPESKEDRARGAAASAGLAGTAEQFLLFRDTGPETFALSVSRIARIEKIPTSRVERVGDAVYLRQATGPTLRLFRLAEHLPLAPAGPLPAEIHVIIPRGEDPPVGLLAPEILDAVPLPADAICTRSVRAPGLLGSASIRDRLCLVVDLPALLAVALRASAENP